MSKTELLELRLKNSMGTQTEVVPKTSYNELKKCRLLARITAQLETNDHDNYCSDEDCKYVKKVVKVSTKVPDEYEDAKIGIINKKNEYAWTKHLPVPEIQVTGSNYLLDACKFKCVEGGVGQHQYRYKIKKVEIIENSKYVGEEVKVNKNGYVILGEHLDPYEYCWTDAHGYAKTLEEARAIAEDAILVGRTKTYFDRKWEEGCRQFDEGSYCRARIIDLDTMDMVDDEYCSNGNGKVKKEKNEKEEESEAVKLFLKTLERK
jgi:hypothetical protein